jgi:hypothetical protein
LAALSLVIALAGSNLEIEAHKPVTSPYTFNADIFPILRDHCGRCHVEGGPAPMGLMRYNEGPNSAVPWSGSIRPLLFSEQMPPWFVDPRGPAIKGGYGLSASQSDKVLVWTSGGTPEGDPEKKPGPVTYQARWSGGPPDLKLPMEAEYTLPASESDATKDFVIPTGLNEQRWLKAIDLLPGSPEVVRSATISLDSGFALGVWVPGDNLVSAPAGTAFRLPAGAKLRLQIHYRKQYQSEEKVFKDRSTVGLYFTTPPAAGREIQSFAIDRPKGTESITSFSGTIPAKARVVAVRPSLDQAYGSFTVQAITPSGSKVPLLKLRLPRTEWRRRYWLANPVDLPAGSRIEISMTPPASYIDLTNTQFLKTYPLQAALDFVSVP